LDFTLTRTLCPLKYIQIICCEALKFLDFINRILAEFHLVTPFKVLYCALVRSLLEYSSVLCDPSITIVRIMIERVQRRFLRLVAHKLSIPKYNPHDYSPILRIISLENLADHRHSANISLLKNLQSYKIDCPEVLSCISLNVPSCHAHSFLSFYIPFSSSNYFLNFSIM
jgi:hypothetical protein